MPSLTGESKQGRGPATAPEQAEGAGSMTCWRPGECTSSGASAPAEGHRPVSVAPLRGGICHGETEYLRSGAGPAIVDGGGRRVGPHGGADGMAGVPECRIQACPVARPCSLATQRRTSLSGPRWRATRRRGRETDTWRGFSESVVQRSRRRLAAGWVRCEAMDRCWTAGRRALARQAAARR